MCLQLRRQSEAGQWVHRDAQEGKKVSPILSQRRGTLRTISALPWCLLMRT